MTPAAESLESLRAELVRAGMSAGGVQWRDDPNATSQDGYVLERTPAGVMLFLQERGKLDLLKLFASEEHAVRDLRTRLTSTIERSEHQRRLRLLASAIVAYLHFGTSPAPEADVDAIRALVPGQDATFLIAKVRDVVEFSLATPVDWSTSSLSDAGQKAAAAVAGVFPGLPDEARKAIAWNFTFAWR